MRNTHLPSADSLAYQVSCGLDMLRFPSTSLPAVSKEVHTPRTRIQPFLQEHDPPPRQRWRRRCRGPQTGPPRSAPTPARPASGCAPASIAKTARDLVQNLLQKLTFLAFCCDTLGSVHQRRRFFASTRSVSSLVGMDKVTAHWHTQLDGTKPVRTPSAHGKGAHRMPPVSGASEVALHAGAGGAQQDAHVGGSGSMTMEGSVSREACFRRTQTPSCLGDVDAQVAVHAGAGRAQQDAQIEAGPLGAVRPAVGARLVAGDRAQRRRQGLSCHAAVPRHRRLPESPLRLEGKETRAEKNVFVRRPPPGTLPMPTHWIGAAICNGGGDLREDDESRQWPQSSVSSLHINRLLQTAKQPLMVCEGNRGLEEGVPTAGAWCCKRAFCADTESRGFENARLGRQSRSLRVPMTARCRHLLRWTPPRNWRRRCPRAPARKGSR